MERKLFSKYDIFLFAAILLSAGICFLLLRASGGARKSVEIYADSERIYEIDCASLSAPEEYQVNAVVIEVTSEGALVKSSPCPDQLCVQRGRLEENGDTAVCAPQRVVVKILGSEKKQDDAIVY